MPNAAQMARLCVLVGHLNQFKLTEGRMHGGDDLATEPHTTTKTSTYEDSEPITDVVTRIIGFVLLEASVETGLFKKTLHECERRLVQGIEVLQPNFNNIGPVNVITTEEPPRSWILRLLQACDLGTDKQISGRNRLRDRDSVQVSMQVSVQ